MDITIVIGGCILKSYIISIAVHYRFFLCMVVGSIIVAVSNSSIAVWLIGCIRRRSNGESGFDLNLFGRFGCNVIREVFEPKLDRGEGCISQRLEEGYPIELYKDRIHWRKS